LKRENQASYGKIVTFTPLSSIQDILLTEDGSSRFITMTLAGGDTVSTQYGADNDETTSFVKATADAAGIIMRDSNHLH
jgi:hypothetical protein